MKNRKDIIHNGKSLHSRILPFLIIAIIVVLGYYLLSNLTDKQSTASQTTEFPAPETQTPETQQTEVIIKNNQVFSGKVIVMKNNYFILDQNGETLNITYETPLGDILILKKLQDGTIVGSDLVELARAEQITIDSYVQNSQRTIESITIE